MKVKTFIGSDAAEVDSQVNAWLAKSRVHVRRTSTAFKRYRDKGKDALTGRTRTRYAFGIAISVWYEDHPPLPQTNPGWSGKGKGRSKRLQ